jgi:hypothetical protein
VFNGLPTDAARVIRLLDDEDDNADDDVESTIIIPTATDDRHRRRFVRVNVCNGYLTPVKPVGDDDDDDDDGMEPNV